MAQVDKIYKQVLDGILDMGYKYIDTSRDVQCTQISSLMISLDLKTMPIITTKKVYINSIIAELIWFLRGDTNIKFLLENKCKIWNDDAYNAYKRACEYCDIIPNLTMEQFLSKVLAGRPTGFSAYPYYGDVGRNYSAQWRDWRGVDAGGEIVHIDQIDGLFKAIEKKIIGRRHIVTAWNPAEINQTALPPCHWAWEVIPKPLRDFEKTEIAISHGKDRIYLETLWNEAHKGDDEAKETLKKELEGIPEYGFTLKWHQRSCDTFLGVPFNIASYGILAVILQAMTGMQALEIIGDLSNVHLYENSLEQAKEQSKRSTQLHPGCGIKFSEELMETFKQFRDGEITVDSVFKDMEVSDFELTGYTSHPPLKVKMIAPKE